MSKQAKVARPVPLTGGQKPTKGSCNLRALHEGYPNSRLTLATGTRPETRLQWLLPTCTSMCDAISQRSHGQMISTSHSSRAAATSSSHALENRPRFTLDPDPSALSITRVVPVRRKTEFELSEAGLPLVRLGSPSSNTRHTEQSASGCAGSGANMISNFIGNLPRRLRRRYRSGERAARCDPESNTKGGGERNSTKKQFRSPLALGSEKGEWRAGSPPKIE